MSDARWTKRFYRTEWSVSAWDDGTVCISVRPDYTRHDGHVATLTVDEARALADALNDLADKREQLDREGVSDA